MTAVGFPNVVAPLGTALTREQCDLLWRMAETPILCFEGIRRVDGLRSRRSRRPCPSSPRAAPSVLHFCPRDRIRTTSPVPAARRRWPTCSARPSRSSSAVVRETEGHPLETPEQRAGLEHRLAELVRTIARREFAKALWCGDAGATRRALGASSQAGRAPRTAGGLKAAEWPARVRTAAGPWLVGAPLPPSSEGFARSPGGSRTVSQREALILPRCVARPTLLEAHAEELAEIDFSESGGAEALRRDHPPHRCGIA